MNNNTFVDRMAMLIQDCYDTIAKVLLTSPASNKHKEGAFSKCWIDFPAIPMHDEIEVLGLRYEYYTTDKPTHDSPNDRGKGVLYAMVKNKNKLSDITKYIEDFSDEDVVMLADYMVQRYTPI